jgi:hypothetical protein
MIIVVGDAPCHGREFYTYPANGDRFPNDHGTTPFTRRFYSSAQEVIQNFVNGKSKLSFDLCYISLHDAIIPMFNVFATYGAKFRQIKPRLTSDGSSSWANSLMVAVTESVVASRDANLKSWGEKKIAGNRATGAFLEKLAEDE